MKPSELTGYLAFTTANRFPVLIKGKPGIGKSDIVEQAAAKAGSHLIISHPVVSDPTDFKGLPFPGKNGTAEFLPFGDLQQIINAKEKTIFFLDDLGQASPSVQAACMQLLLARRINSHKVSDLVTFIAATNRREDRAGVNGLLEPVKSRFISIVELKVDTADWVKWAFAHNMPAELIGFIQFKPDLLDNFVPSKDIDNSASPRTVAAVGLQQAAGLPKAYEFEAYKGAAGEAFAREYMAFLQIYRSLPSLDDIIEKPTTARIPDDISVTYAISCALAKNMTDQNIGNICQYLDRLPVEISMACMTAATVRDKHICNNRAFIQWASENGEIQL